MPADPADIGPAIRDVAVATWTDAAIVARYPSQARDGSASPADGYFDAIADAQTVVNARGAIIGTETRRFAVSVNDLEWPVISTSVPLFRLVDAEQGANVTLFASRIELDLENEVTALELFGAG
jgi:hypothetical protein